MGTFLNLAPRVMRHRLPGLLVIVVGSGALAKEPGFLTSILAPGAYRAEVFTMGMPMELAGAQATLARNVAQKQSWFRDYVARLHLAPGEMLPYAPEMGLSQADYAKLMEAYQHPTVMPLATTQVSLAVEKGTARFEARSWS